jgi:hypothetical protein
VKKKLPAMFVFLLYLAFLSTRHSVLPGAGRFENNVFFSFLWHACEKLFEKKFKLMMMMMMMRK